MKRYFGILRGSDNLMTLAHNDDTHHFFLLPVEDVMLPLALTNISGVCRKAHIQASKIVLMFAQFPLMSAVLMFAPF